VRDGGRSSAIDLQELIANHCKRRWSKASVVSVTEKAPLGVRYELRRRTHVNHRSSVEITSNDVKTEEVMLPRDKFSGNLFIG